MAETAKVRLKRGSTATWTAADNNKTDGSSKGKAWLEEGQPGVEYTESNDVRLKVGPKGGGYWNNIPYVENYGIQSALSGISNGMSSFSLRLDDVEDEITNLKHFRLNAPNIIAEGGANTNGTIPISSSILYPTTPVYSDNILDYNMLRAILKVEYRQEERHFPILLYKTLAMPSFDDIITAHSIVSCDECFYGVVYNKGISRCDGWGPEADQIEVIVFIDHSSHSAGQDAQLGLIMYSPLLEGSSGNEVQSFELYNIKGVN